MTTSSSLIRSVALVAMMTAPGLASAGVAAAETAKASQTSDCARARKLGKTCELTIDPEDVDGSKPTAVGTTVAARDFSKFGTLIRLRRDFIDAVVKTADDLE